MPEFDSLRIDIEDAIAYLRLNRPQRANAFHAPLWRSFPAALEWLATQTQVRALIICGEGEHFCSGVDVSMLAELRGLVADPNRATRGREALFDLISRLQASFSAIERYPAPVIAAIHGACIGGGVDLISACDIRLCSADASFCVKEIDLAVVPDVGTLQRLSHVIGYSNVTELSYTAETFGADRAQALGLVSRVEQTPRSLMQTARQMAQSIARKSPATARGIKRNLQWARDHTVQDGLTYTATWNAAMLVGEDLSEAMAAFSEKRAPRFQD